ncbi:hypothetical protein HHI36_011302 [Cryptolaemus montrouzieri]|uniref:Uncharacterized protein n=1 Tax=Cryptolaemus montrouzieri TaxID=559131 RepID=A0ABD2MLG9_9CUCU
MDQPHGDSCYETITHTGGILQRHPQPVLANSSAGFFTRNADDQRISYRGHPESEASTQYQRFHLQGFHTRNSDDQRIPPSTSDFICRGSTRETPMTIGWEASRKRCFHSHHIRFVNENLLFLFSAFEYCLKKCIEYYVRFIVLFTRTRRNLT